MFKISPLTKKRFRAFKRIRRAWYSLIALIAIFIATLFAEVISPYSPSTVIAPDSLAHYKEDVVEKFIANRASRYTISVANEIEDFEGPRDVRDMIFSNRDKLEKEFAIREKACADGSTRVFLTPRDAPEIRTEIKPPLPIAYPFRPCREHIFGIDSNGFDVLSRVIYGLRLSLLFGLVLAISGMILGLVIGAIEGYFGGVIDLIAQRLTEIWSAMPFLYVMIFIGSAIGTGLSDFQRFLLLIACYAIFNWIAVSYYMRAEFLRLRSRTFVESAKCQGFSSSRIIFSHILPNALTPLITLFPFLLMGAIGSLAALDFLGFGLPPMAPSCGELLRQAQSCPSAWWLILFPSLALFIVMLLTVLIGEGLRDAFDPRQKSKLE